MAVARLLQHSGHPGLAADLALRRAHQAYAAAAHLPDVHPGRVPALKHQQVPDLLLRDQAQCSYRAQPAPTGEQDPAKPEAKPWLMHQVGSGMRLNH